MSKHGGHRAGGVPNPQTLRKASRGKFGQEWEMPPSRGVAVSQTWPEGQKQELRREGRGEPGLRTSGVLGSGVATALGTGAVEGIQGALASCYFVYPSPTRKWVFELPSKIFNWKCVT